MIKLAGLIIDSYDDPEFVNNPNLSSSGVPSSDAIARLQDRDFAILIKTASGTHRKFPLASPSLVKVSAAYFNTYGHQLPTEMRKAAQFRIQEAAESANVKLAGAVAEPVNSSEFANKFSFTVTGEAMPQSEPITKQAAFDLAQQEWLANFGRMTPAERVVAAYNLSKVASITDQRIMDYVPKDGYGPNFENGMKQREAILKDDIIKHAQFCDLKTRILDMDSKRGAVLLDQMDKSAGIVGRVPDAFVTCWSGAVKLASCDMTSVEQNQVANLAVNYPGVVKQVLAPEVANRFLRGPIQYYNYVASPSVKKAIDALIKKLPKKEDDEVETEDMKEIKEKLEENKYVPWSKK